MADGERGMEDGERRWGEEVEVSRGQGEGWYMGKEGDREWRRELEEEERGR